MIYINVATGERFIGTLPNVLTVPISKEEGKFTLTEMVSAAYGEDHYQDVLDVWMLIRGYMKVDDGETVTES